VLPHDATSQARKHRAATASSPGTCTHREGKSRSRPAHATRPERPSASYVVRFHLAAAALRAISERLSGVSFAALALPPLRPPLRPKATADGSLSRATRAVSACLSLTSLAGAGRGAASEWPLRERSGMPVILPGSPAACPVPRQLPRGRRTSPTAEGASKVTQAAAPATQGSFRPGAARRASLPGTRLCPAREALVARRDINDHRGPA